MNVTALYAALLALLVVRLSMNVVKARRAARVALGDGGDERLQRAMRAHGNCVEYAPLALVAIGLAEAGGVPAPIIHALGAALVAGRLIHAWGITRPKENLRFRVVGMLLTYGVLTLAAVADLWVALR